MSKISVCLALAARGMGMLVDAETCSLRRAGESKPLSLHLTLANS